MDLHPAKVYHIYNRGNNRKQLFYHEDNYPYFIGRIRKFLAPNCDVLAYCLLPNHFHLLVSGNDRSALPYRSVASPVLERVPETRVPMSRFSQGLQMTLSSYTKAINKRHNRVGSLFTQNTHCKQTSNESYLEDYSLACFIYLHQNPVEAGLVSSPEEWPYSSYREYLGTARDPLCNVALGKEILSMDRNKLIEFHDVEVPDHIRVRFF